MTPIARAPDATVFLSTAALITGIFLTVVTAALASSLPEKLEDLIGPLNRADHGEWYTRALRSTLFILIITNTLGTLFPFTLLAVNTVTSISSAWVWVVFAYSISTIFINLGAVTTVFVVPFNIRRKLGRDGSNAVGEDAGPSSTLAPSKAAQEAVGNSSAQGTPWHSLVKIVLGIVIGLTVAIRFKRQK